MLFVLLPMWGSTELGLYMFCLVCTIQYYVECIAPSDILHRCSFASGIARMGRPCPRNTLPDGCVTASPGLIGGRDAAPSLWSFLFQHAVSTAYFSTGAAALCATPCTFIGFNSGYVKLFWVRIRRGCEISLDFQLAWG